MSHDGVVGFGKGACASIRPGRGSGRRGMQQWRYFPDEGVRGSIPGESSGDALGSRLPGFPRVRGVQADAADAQCFLNQIVGDRRAFSRHHRARRQGKAQRISLIFEVQNDLPRHKNSPCVIDFQVRFEKNCDEEGARERDQELAAIVTEPRRGSQCFSWFPGRQKYMARKN